MNSSSINVSTTFSSSIQVPSIANNYSASHNSQYSTNSVNSANNSPISSYTKNSKLDLKINLNSSSSSSNSHTQNKGEKASLNNDNHSNNNNDLLKESVTPMTPDTKHNFAFHPDQEDVNNNDEDVTDKNYKVTVQGQTPTPTMKRQTPSVHVKDTEEEFPTTDPVMGSIDENVEHEHDSKESEEEETSESEEEEEEEQIIRSEEEIETELLGRFGYLKHKTITKTLQGNIFVAKVDASSSSQTKDGKKKNKKEKQVVIKKTSKQLHSEHVTVQNGKKFGIYENILKECIILKHLTENRNGLIMTSFTKYDNFFDDDNYYYLSMEHGGSDLFDFIIEAHELIANKKLKIKEWRKFTKYLFWQMIVVLKWLHNDMNICHLDISLENILIKNGNFVPLDKDKTQYTINSNVQIKICDFGLAEIFNQNSDFKCTKFCGKTNYKAPEVYGKKGIFDARKADIWSLGVVLFCMLVGSPPYNKPIDSDPAYLYIKNGIIDQLLFQWEKSFYYSQSIIIIT